jgi:hypothetical protein
VKRIADGAAPSARMMTLLYPPVGISRPDTTHQDAAGSTQSDPDDPEVVPVCRTYGSFRKLGVTPRMLATAPERFTKCQ